jgi:hypothetical protein
VAESGRHKGPQREMREERGRSSVCGVINQRGLAAKVPKGCLGCSDRWDRSN